MSDNSSTLRFTIGRPLTVSYSLIARILPPFTTLAERGEAAAIRRRLRSAWELPQNSDSHSPVKRTLLVRAALCADPRSAYVSRHRRGRAHWGNGGTEIQLARESAVDEEKTEAAIVLASMALGQGYRDQHIYATCAMPVTFVQLAKESFGEERVKHVQSGRQSVTAKIERVYAGKVIEK